MLHPPRGNDRKSLPMRNVIICRERMFHTVAGPAGTTVSKRIDPVASIRAVKHHFRPCCIVFRILQTLLCIYHKALKRRFHKSIVKKCGILAEILLHNVIHCIRTAGRRLFSGYRKCVRRIKERKESKYCHWHCSPVIRITENHRVIRTNTCRKRLEFRSCILLLVFLCLSNAGVIILRIWCLFISILKRSAPIISLIF